MNSRKHYTVEEIQRGFSLAIERAARGLPAEYVSFESFRNAVDNEFHAREIAKASVSNEKAYAFVLVGFACVEIFLGDKAAKKLAANPNKYFLYRSLFDIRLLQRTLNEIPAEAEPDVQATIVGAIATNYALGGFPTRPLEAANEFIESLELHEEIVELTKSTLSESLKDARKETFH